MRGLPSKILAGCLTASILPSTTALSAAAHGVRTMDLVSRASAACPLQGYSPCSQMPAGFCCESGMDCVAFNNAQSVLCCPKGADCSTIAPITCDLSQQDAKLHPANQVHTTSLDGVLETCGDSCCPRGFRCQFSQCIRADNRTTSSTTTPSATSKFSTASTPSSTDAPLQTSTSRAPLISPESHCDKYPVTAILAGVFPGLALGALLTTLAMVCIGRHRASRQKQKSNELDNYPTTVSDPIYNPQSSAFRTDFLRRGSVTRSKLRTSSNRTSKVRSLFSRSPAIRQPDSFGYGFKKSAESSLRTPTRSSTKTPLRSPIRTPKMRREPSTESIKIYSPPNGGLRPTTTFTDMMADAGFRTGEPFMQIPEQIHSRNRI
ncbi:hypothetical protein MMC31_006413 [Peltigera leucophlebia]|nr:hypothetical protein [Peltigera leucophlebia]